MEDLKTASQRPCEREGSCDVFTCFVWWPSSTVRTSRFLLFLTCTPSLPSSYGDHPLLTAVTASVMARTGSIKKNKGLTIQKKTDIAILRMVLYYNCVVNISLNRLIVLNMRRCKLQGNNIQMPSCLFCIVMLHLSLNMFFRTVLRHATVICGQFFSKKESDLDSKSVLQFSLLHPNSDLLQRSAQYVWCSASPLPLFTFQTEVKLIYVHT